MFSNLFAMITTSISALAIAVLLYVKGRKDGKDAHSMKKIKKAMHLLQIAGEIEKDAETKTPVEIAKELEKDAFQ